MRANRLTKSLSSGQLVTVQGGIHSVTSAAQDLLNKHLAEFQTSYSSFPKPISVYMDSSAQHESLVVVEFSLPTSADVTAVLASALNVNRLTPARSTPIRRKLFGEVTLGDRMEGASYSLVDDEHHTVIKTDTCDVTLSRSLTTSSAMLRLTAFNNLGAAHALALARAYYLAHQPVPTIGVVDAGVPPNTESGGEDYSSNV